MDSLSNPTAAQYTPTIQTTPAHHDNGGLPFTGLDVVMLLIVAVALVAIGVALRRLSSL